MERSSGVRTVENLLIDAKHMSGGQNLLSLVNAKVGVGRPLSVLQVLDVYIRHNYL